MRKQFDIQKVENGYIISNALEFKQFVFNSCSEMGEFIDMQLSRPVTLALFLLHRTIPSDKKITAIKLVRELRKNHGGDDQLVSCKKLIDGVVDEPVIIINDKGLMNSLSMRFHDEVGCDSMIRSIGA